MANNPRFKRVIQYLWDSEPEHIDFENDIVCLGKTYSPVSVIQTPADPDSSVVISEEEAKTTWPADFLSDVEARIWMSYRTNFELIPRAKQGPSPVSIGGLLRGSGLDINGFTSDVGWGCMIRTGQSLLANCLAINSMGRDWRRPKDGTVDIAEAEILELFVDTPTAPFGIHKFVAHGETSCGKMPGEWFGPSAAASSIQALQNSHSHDLRVYISSGSDVYEDLFLKTATKDGVFCPTLILLGLRLGIDSVNKVYWDSIKYFLSCSQAIGIAGGRPSSSHYFYGYQGNHLFYLDPHFPRPCLSAKTVEELTPSAIDTVHTNRIRQLHLEEMDPSMLVGFLIRDEADWNVWKSTIKDPAVQKIIHISSKPPTIRRGSVISESDDEDGLIDIMLEPEEDAPVLIGSLREDYDNCQDYDEVDMPASVTNGSKEKEAFENIYPEDYGSPNDSKVVMVDTPQEDTSYDMDGQSIFLMDHLMESNGTSSRELPSNRHVPKVDATKNEDQHVNQQAEPHTDDKEASLPTSSDADTHAISDTYDLAPSTSGAVQIPARGRPPYTSTGSGSASGARSSSLSASAVLQSSSCSISSSPVKISRSSYMTDRSSSSLGGGVGSVGASGTGEDWEYMSMLARSDATLQKSGSSDAAAAAAESGAVSPQPQAQNGSHHHPLSLSALGTVSPLSRSPI